MLTGRGALENKGLHHVEKKGISEMSRNFARALALAAGLGASSTVLADAGHIVPVHPTFGNIEVVATGEDDGNAFIVIRTANVTNATALANGTFQVQFYASDGVTTVGGLTAIANADVVEEDVGGTAGTVETNDEFTINMATYIQGVSATAAMFDIIFADGGATDDQLVNNADAATGGTDATDTRFQINRNQPSLSQALVDVDGASSHLYLVFSIAEVGPTGGTTQAIGLSEADDGGAAVPDNPDDTETAALSNADFETSTSATGTFTALAAADVTSFALADGSTFIDITFDASTSVLDNTSLFIRMVDDGDVFDASGANAQQTAIQITTLANLAIDSAEWVESVGDGSSVGGALRVFFNLPLNPGVTPSADFFTVELANGDDPAGVTVDAVTLDPDNNNAVLLDITMPGGYGVAANGLSFDDDGGDGIDADGVAFNVSGSADDGTTDPQDIFGNDFTGDDSAEAEDAIAPSVQSVAFEDVDGDGEQDAATIVYDEELSDTSATSGLTLRAVDGVTVFPFAQIEEDGDLVEDETDIDAGEEEIETFTVSVVDVDLDRDGTIDENEENIGVRLAHDPATTDWDGDEAVGAADTDGEATPGTGDGGAVSVEYDADAAGADIEDANGNAAPDLAVTNATDDFALPVPARTCIFTGDNADDGGDLNDQCFFETDGDPGDQNDNTRLSVHFSEDVFNGGISLANIQFGSAGATFDDGFFLGQSDSNNITVSLSGAIDQDFLDDLVDGAAIAFVTGNNVVDGSGNEVNFSGEIAEDCTALYSALQVDVNNGTVAGAFLVDADDDGFVDQIRIRMTQPVDADTLDVTDFSINFGGTITDVDVDATDENIIVLTVTDGIVSIQNTVTLTYNGSDDSTPINSDTALGGNGFAVSAIDCTESIEKLVEPIFDTFEMAQMPLRGTITLDGTTPAPVGTKVFVFIPVPVAQSIRATHNNVPFIDETSGSREAFTNFILELHPFVYLMRDEDTNFQFYRNEKFTNDIVVDDTISCTINATNLASVTFTGTGETSGDRIASGSVRMCWDVLRSSDGTLISLYNNGYSIGGEPIVSSGVVTGDTGAYGMHVSAPISAFNGRSRLDCTNRPVIVMVELTNGRRLVVSSLLTSVNGSPLLFTPYQRNQSGDDALDAVEFNINLARVDQQTIYPGWNTEPFNCQSGWASATSTRPLRPAGIDESEIVVGTSLVNVNALDQFVYFIDDNEDGFWTRDDDGDRFDGIVISTGCLNAFFFTMTSFGVQLNTGINNFVGGYAFAFFNADAGTNYGCFQWGPTLDEQSVFSSASNFPNNTTTRGWVLGTITTPRDPASGFFTANALSDYIIIFNNNGPDGIDVFSLDAGGGSADVDNLTEIPDNQAAFFHVTLP